MEQKTQSKYILLEKPIFFNSKLNPKSQENISETQAQNKNTENNNNQNNQNKSPQKYRTFLNDPNETAWHYRYERKGYTNPNLLQDQEGILVPFLLLDHKFHLFYFHKVQIQE